VGSDGAAHGLAQVHAEFRGNCRSGRIFGMTLSPYFGQASEEVEDMRAGQGALPLVRDAGPAAAELRRIRWDTWSGMLYSDITAYFIILATAVTLNVAGITNITTAAQVLAA